LGTQVTGLNGSYFWQNSGINRIQMYGEMEKQASPLNANDIVAVLVDFDRQIVSYFKNGHLEGFTAVTKKKLREGR
jgi:hypothetical protein